jgi:hypothetical protein
MQIDYDQIAKEIADLPLKGALLYLAAKGVQVFGKGAEKVKQIIADKVNKQHYAFVPDKKEAEKLKELSRDPGYQLIRSLIPKYRYLDVIRTGLLLKSYMDSSETTNDERTKHIKTGIGQRPNGKKLISVVHLSTTPYFSSVVSYLIRLKNSGYSENQLLETFEEIVDEWDESHFPVRSDDAAQEVKKFCLKKMDEHRRNVFLIGIKEASKTIEEVMEDLDTEDAFKERGYEVFTEKCTSGVEPRIEVTMRYKSEVDKFAESAEQEE